MFVTWRATPALPGPITDRITVSDASFQIDHFQVVGDAGNDVRTTHVRYLLTWKAGTTPQQEKFFQAPVGVYSKVALVMASFAGEDHTYEIHGTWRNAAGVTKSFEIRDEEHVYVSVDCDEMLPAGGSADLTIKLDLVDALGGINFAAIDEPGEDEIKLEDGLELVAFRGRLSRAFTLDP